MSLERKINILHHIEEDVYHFAPVPLVYHLENDVENWHAELVEVARQQFTEPVLEVPDVRHIESMGSPPSFDDATWSESCIPAVGVWHRVPTNNFLNIDHPAVLRLRHLVEQRYQNALITTEGFRPESVNITESWIQFYKDSDYKVLHNHERYGRQYPAEHRWAGAYYIQDGDPDSSIPYSGILSFRVRQSNYCIKPKRGLLLIWPADILHEVHPFYGSNERIVINFNICIPPQ